MTHSPPGADGQGDVSIETYEGDPEPWDTFVRGAHGSSFCHLRQWSVVMREVLGHECLYRVARDAGGEWVGVLPLVRVRSALFGDYLVSMPFLNYGGPIGSSEARLALATGAVDLARALGVDLLELRSRGERPDSPLHPADRKVTVLLDLPDDPDTLWKDVLRAKVRSQVRRPQKEGMTARFGVDQVEPFYEVFASHMRDLGTPVLPRALFEGIAAVFPREVEFGCVYVGDVPVAAGCGFAWRGEFEMTWASSLRAYNRQAPNMLLYWSFMERMIERRMTVFNFGRCTPGGGTHRFKLQWSGRDEPLPWGQWSPKGVSATPNPERPLYRTATKVWRRLPLGVANWLGPVLARRIP